jgi:DNA-binding NtrC family response regulator
VESAATGAEAVKKSKEKAYNLALFDIRLPDMEGVELLKLIKDATPKTRKIIMTGYPSMENAVTAVNNDADAYLIKPLDIKKLVALVREQLSKQDSERMFCEEKVAEFIESRVKEISQESS